MSVILDAQILMKPAPPGPAAPAQLRDVLRTGQLRQGVRVVINACLRQVPRQLRPALPLSCATCFALGSCSEAWQCSLKHET
jgi:hypothetical protein